MDPLTAKIGACNTLRTGRMASSTASTPMWWGGAAARKAAASQGSALAVLGAGGAARAAVFGLVDQGAEVFVINRTHETCGDAGAPGEGEIAEARGVCETAFRCADQRDAVWHEGCEAGLPIAENELNAGMVFDMVYNPLETPLLKLARPREPCCERAGDVCAAGRAAVRDLDGQASTGERNAAGCRARAAPPRVIHRMPVSSQF